LLPHTSREAFVRNLAPVTRQNADHPKKLRLKRPSAILYFGKLLNPATSTTSSIMVLPEVDDLSFLFLHWSLPLALGHFSLLPTLMPFGND
jgi:hypothetical protein